MSSDVESTVEEPSIQNEHELNKEIEERIDLLTKTISRTIEFFQILDAENIQDFHLNNITEFRKLLKADLANLTQIYKDNSNNRHVNTLRHYTHAIASPLLNITAGSSFLLHLIYEKSEDVEQIEDNLNLIKSNLSLAQEYAEGLRRQIEKESINALPVNIRDFFNHLEIKMRSTQTTGKLTPPWTVDLKSENVTSIFDPHLIEMAIFNIITNAEKYSLVDPHSQDNSKYPISVGMRTTTINNRPHIEFFVTNTGIGIPKNERTIIFQKGGRASNAISSGRPGDGTGLDQTVYIMKLHNGNVDFEQADTVTTFYLKFPIKTEM